MNFLFWNINKKNTSFLFDKISILIQNEHIDVCMLAELDQADTAKYYISLTQETVIPIR